MSYIRYVPPAAPVTKSTHCSAQMFEKEAEAHDMLLGLVDSVMDVSFCVTEVKRFKTSDQLISRLQELEPMVLDVSKLVHDYQSRSNGMGASTSI
jgi:hypothetical protein